MGGSQRETGYEPSPCHFKDMVEWVKIDPRKLPFSRKLQCAKKEKQKEADDIFESKDNSERGQENMKEKQTGLKCTRGEVEQNSTSMEEFQSKTGYKPSPRYFKDTTHEGGIDETIDGRLNSMHTGRREPLPYHEERVFGLAAAEDAVKERMSVSTDQDLPFYDGSTNVEVDGYDAQAYGNADETFTQGGRSS
jgi:hypothetical protein